MAEIELSRPFQQEITAVSLLCCYTHTFIHTNTLCIKSLIFITIQYYL